MASLVKALQFLMPRHAVPTTDAEGALTYQAFDVTRDLGGKAFRALCYAPFVQLSFSPNGNASACCISRTEVLGNVAVDRLDDIWRGERALEFRETLQRYEFPSGCESCKWSLDAGNFLDHPIREFDGVPVRADLGWPARLEFALSNTCNLACIMCSGELSSVIRAKEGLPALPHVYGDQFFEDLGPYLTHTQHLTFLGGEPFLQFECHRIWDMLIAENLSPSVHVTTNGSQYNDRVERVLRNLPVDLAISVDGITKDTVESIRVNNKYETIMENIQRFNAYVQGTSDKYPRKRARHLTLNFCVMPQNWRELPEFFSFAQTLDAHVWTTLVIHPRSCSVVALPAGELRTIISTLEADARTLLPKLSAHNRRVWSELLKELHNHAAEAEGTLNAVIKARNSTNPLATAWSLLAAGDLQGASEAVTQVPTTHDQYYLALSMLAQIRITGGDLAGAEEATSQALKRFPRRPESHIAQARLRYKQGRIQEGLEAIDLAERALSDVRRTDFTSDQMLIVAQELHLVGASLAEAAGDASAAVAHLERILEATPDHPDATTLRDQLTASVS